MSKFSKRTLEILDKAAYLETRVSNYDMSHVEIEKIRLADETGSMNIADYVTFRLIEQLNNVTDEEMHLFANALTGALYLLRNDYVNEWHTVKFFEEHECFSEIVNAIYNIAMYFYNHNCSNDSTMLINLTANIFSVSDEEEYVRRLIWQVKKNLEGGH